MVDWQRRHGRKGLPWQGARDPYRVWLSEVMLQQTQVSAVIPYYERFLKRFPTVESLSRADENDVLQLWSGLGYYARGRNLHKAAKQIVANGFPRTAAKIAELPGVGRSTAAAIAAFAFGERAAILDGNVKRVLARYARIKGFPGDKKIEAKLWTLADSLLPKKNIETYTQALMDLGATLCTKTKPRCGDCPVKKTCVALEEGLTGKLPSPRPKKAIPSKTTTWLVLRHAGQILLEKRPSLGIWGGLWSFPEINGEDPAGYCRTKLGCDLESMTRLDDVEHGFTHYHLTIHPLLCEVTPTTRAAEPGLLWIDVEDAARAATPAPVRKLVQTHLF
ncbi:MAG TPA: A/G-specific adenine glycosylase [Burkholderiales bacterium]